jgi:hypothetical protein
MGAIRWLAGVACSIAVALTVAGCGPGQQYAAGATTTLDSGAQHIQIFANGDWRDTGVRVARGQTYRVTAEGRWSMGGICGLSDGSGAGISPLCAGDPLGLGIPSGTLVGRIGAEGKPFPVGTALTMTAEAEGPLFLWGYDIIPGDNTGALNVTIAREGTRGPTMTFQAAAPRPAPMVPRPPEPAAQPALAVPLPAGTEGHRLALVIGNGAYREAPPLTNPVNDARLISQTLRGLGFDVIEVLDADQTMMKRAIQGFGAKLDQHGKDGVGLFFYAGHGVQARGKNFLMPVSAHIEREADLEIEAVPADSVLAQMEDARSRLNFVILDACRNNPFGRGFRSASRGLARMDAPAGTLIAYSTAPGDVAVDGDGANSPYSENLARAMRQNGVPVEQTFKQVRLAVREATREIQTPWESSSLTGEFYFAR